MATRSSPFVGSTLAAALLAGSATAEIQSVEAEGSVSEVVDRLEAAVEEAGATVVARVDHSGAAEGAGLEMTDAELLIFGNPKLGTPAMQLDPVAGLYLPVRVLAYADADGTTILTFEDAATMLEGTDISPDDPALAPIDDAVNALVAKAASAR